MKKKKLLNKYIERNPNIFDGRAVIKGRRIPVAFVLGQMSANGGTIRGVQKVYPQLSTDEIRAALDYSTKQV